MSSRQIKRPIRTLAVTSVVMAAFSASACGQDLVTLDREELVERGDYLVNTIAGCGNCHTPHNDDGTLNQDMKLAGAYVITEPVFEAYAKNITPDMETGIGSWTEDEIVDALRNGVRPDGQVLGPPMSFAFYRDLSDNDAYAIAAYLKTIEPIRNEVPDSTYEIPLDWGPPVSNVPDVPRDDPVRYGEYLAGPVGHCMDCHTTYVDGVPDFDQVGRGQNVFPQMGTPHEHPGRTRRSARRRAAGRPSAAGGDAARTTTSARRISTRSSRICVRSSRCRPSTARASRRPAAPRSNGETTARKRTRDAGGPRRGPSACSG